MCFFFPCWEIFNDFFVVAFSSLPVEFFSSPAITVDTNVKFDWAVLTEVLIMESFNLALLNTPAYRHRLDGRQCGSDAILFAKEDTYSHEILLFSTCKVMLTLYSIITPFDVSKISCI